MHQSLGYKKTKSSFSLLQSHFLTITEWHNLHWRGIVGNLNIVCAREAKRVEHLHHQKALSQNKRWFIFVL